MALVLLKAFTSGMHCRSSRLWSQVHRVLSNRMQGPPLALAPPWQTIPASDGPQDQQQVSLPWARVDAAVDSKTRACESGPGWGESGRRKMPGREAREEWSKEVKSKDAPRMMPCVAPPELLAASALPLPPGLAPTSWTSHQMARRNGQCGLTLGGDGDRRGRPGGPYRRAGAEWTSRSTRPSGLSSHPARCASFI